jgi:hypothetical protein
VYYHLIEMVMGSEVNGSLCHKPSSEVIPHQLENSERRQRELSAVPKTGSDDQ